MSAFRSGRLSYTGLAEFVADFAKFARFLFCRPVNERIYFRGSHKQRSYVNLDVAISASKDIIRTSQQLQTLLQDFLDRQTSRARKGYATALAHKVLAVLMSTESARTFLGDLRERYGERPSAHQWIQIVLSLRPLLAEKIATALRPRKAAKTR